jgi:EAL and modified HD-GYP domain-containing signal transduction protein
MDVCIARKPIFDRNMKVYGYDLLYCENTIANTVSEADVKSELVYDSFFVIGIDDLTNGAAAFIRFSRALVDGDIPVQFPRDKIVVEVFEEDYNKQVTAEDCVKIKSLGYRLALDGFILDDANIGLLKAADIIKINFSAATITTQAAMVGRFKGNVRFLADNIETREDYTRAADIGYDLFGGSFFTKPSYVNTKEIESLDMNLFNLIQELDRPEPDYAVLSEIIERDLGLSYKLLKFVNSAAMSSGYKIVSISRAVTYLGTRTLRQFLSVILVKKHQTNENEELVKLSLVRGKLMSLLASELGLGEAGSAYFFTGIFSLIDVILDRSMREIVHELPLIGAVKQALLGENNPLRRMLDFIVRYENARWDLAGNAYPMNRIDKNMMMSLYIDALRWANILD